MVLIPVFLLLLAGWVLWMWSLAEDNNLRWLRVLCAKLFVVIVFVVGVGAGVVVTRLKLKSQYRADVEAFAAGLQAQIRADDHDQLLEHLSAVVEEPDEWSSESGDILERMTAATERMQQAAEDQQPLERVVEHPARSQRR